VILGLDDAHAIAKRVALKALARIADRQEFPTPEIAGCGFGAAPTSRRILR
jgi:hypothetical protein